MIFGIGHTCGIQCVPESAKHHPPPSKNTTMLFVWPVRVWPLCLKKREAGKEGFLVPTCSKIVGRRRSILRKRRVWVKLKCLPGACDQMRQGKPLTKHRAPLDTDAWSNRSDNGPGSANAGETHSAATNNAAATRRAAIGIIITVLRATNKQQQKKKKHKTATTPRSLLSRPA